MLLGCGSVAGGALCLCGERRRLWVIKGKDISASLFPFRPFSLKKIWLTLLHLSFTQVSCFPQPELQQGGFPLQNGRLVPSVETWHFEETAINIGVATGLLAAEQGKAERPMSLRQNWWTLAVMLGEIGLIVSAIWDVVEYYFQDEEVMMFQDLFFLSCQLYLGL